MIPTIHANGVPFKVIGHSCGVAHAPKEECQSLSVAKSIDEWKNLCTNMEFPCDDIAAKVDFSRNNLIILSLGTCDPSHVIAVNRIRKIGNDILQIQHGQVDLNPTCPRRMTCGFSSLYATVDKNVVFKSLRLDFVNDLQPEIFDDGLKSKKEGVNKVQKDFFDFQEKLYDLLPIDEWDKLDGGKNITELKLHNEVDLKKAKKYFSKYVSAKVEYKQKLKKYNKIRAVYLNQLCGPNLLHPEGQ